VQSVYLVHSVSHLFESVLDVARGSAVLQCCALMAATWFDPVFPVEAFGGLAFVHLDAGCAGAQYMLHVLRNTVVLLLYMSDISQWCAWSHLTEVCGTEYTADWGCQDDDCITFVDLMHVVV
jgi:hypothetical protein